MRRLQHTKRGKTNQQVVAFPVVNAHEDSIPRLRLRNGYISHMCFRKVLAKGMRKPRDSPTPARKESQSGICSWGHNDVRSVYVTVTKLSCRVRTPAPKSSRVHDDTRVHLACCNLRMVKRAQSKRASQTISRTVRKMRQVGYTTV